MVCHRIRIFRDVCGGDAGGSMSAYARVYALIGGGMTVVNGSGLGWK